MYTRDIEARMAADAILSSLSLREGIDETTRVQEFTGVHGHKFGGYYACRSILPSFLTHQCWLTVNLILTESSRLPASSPELELAVGEEQVTIKVNQR